MLLIPLLFGTKFSPVEKRANDFQSCFIAPACVFWLFLRKFFDCLFTWIQRCIDLKEQFRSSPHWIYQIFPKYKWSTETCLSIAMSRTKKFRKNNNSILSSDQNIFMAQYGLHCLLAIWLVSLFPVIHPTSLRASFLIGLYFGCVFPDLDVYVEAVVYVIDQSVADRDHRTYLHSIISALFLLLLFTMCHKIYSFYLERKRFKRKMNDQAEAERAYLLPGERASEIKHGSHIQDFD